jgi:MFS transporter, YNFM family, putative membrane transport protein
MTFIEKGTKEYHRASFALFLAGFAIFATLYSTQPLMPIFAKEFNVSPSVSSLTLSLTTGTLSVALLLAASVSDKIGRKQIMLFSLIITSVSGLLIAYSPNFIILASVRGVLGVFLAGVPAIAMTYIGEEFAPKGVGKIMGFYISGNTLGGLTGRLLTGVVTDLFSWRIAMLSIGLLSALLTIVFWVLLPKERHFVKKSLHWKSTILGYTAQLKNKRILLLILLPFLLMGSFVTLYNYIGFLLMGHPYNLSQTIIGFIFIVYLAGTFSAVYMGRMADEYERSRIVKVSIVIFIIGALITLIPHLIVKIIGMIIFTFGFFGCHSVTSTWIGAISKKNKAQAAALYLFCYYFGSSIIGSLGGIFWSYFHWLGVISLIVFLAIVSLSVVFYLTKIESTNHEVVYSAHVR